MDEMLAFVRRCIDEDERLALRLPDHRLYVCDDGHVEEPIGKWDDGSDRLPNHHNTWLPMYDRARVLAEVEAKRRILDLAADLQEREGRYAKDFVAALAQPYAGQAGWREEWRNASNGS